MSKLSFFLQSITLILMPLYILRFQFFIPTTLLEVLILLTVFITFLDFIKDGANFSEINTPFDPLIFLFLVSAIVSVFYTFEPIKALGILKAYFFEPILFFYSLIFTSHKFGKEFIINSLIISGVWLSLLSLLQKITGQFSLAPYEIIQGRITGVYNSANSLSLYLAPISFLTLYKFYTEKKYKRLIYLLFFIFFILILFWTRSRGGMLAEFLSLLIFGYIFLVLKNRIFKKIWYIPLFGVLIFVLVYLTNFYNRTNLIPFFSQPYSLGDTLQIRYFLWGGTVNLLKDHPITGAGLNGFKTLYSNQYRLPYYQEEFQYPHNIFLTFWAETGILGLFAFLLVVVSTYSLVIKNLERDKYLGASLIAILSYLLIHGLVDVPYFKNDLSVEFWTFIALAVIGFEKFKVEG